MSEIEPEQKTEAFDPFCVITKCVMQFHQLRFFSSSFDVDCVAISFSLAQFSNSFMMLS